jgi:molybdate transport system substrate-binding protein
VRVAAASDLAPAFEEIGHAFTAATGRPVVFTFGSTGALAAQLEQGAPFDVFAAAQASYVDRVVNAGVCDGATRAVLGHGRLVAWSRPGGVARASAVAELVDARFARIAIANPDHAPYGVAAREALIAAGLWSALEGRMVLAENVRQALQFADTGNVDVALVAQSLVAPRADADPLLLPDSLHAPLVQSWVVCARGERRAGADALSAWMVGAEGRRVLDRFGLALPSAVAHPSAR